MLNHTRRKFHKYFAASLCFVTDSHIHVCKIFMCCVRARLNNIPSPYELAWILRRTEREVNYEYFEDVWHPRHNIVSFPVLPPRYALLARRGHTMALPTFSWDIVGEQPTGMMTRHHPATGASARMGETMKSRLVGRQEPVNDLEGIYLRTDTRVPGYGGSFGQDSLSREKQRVAKFLPHGVLVAKPPLNLDKSVERKWGNSLICNLLLSHTVGSQRSCSFSRVAR